MNTCNKLPEIKWRYDAIDYINGTVRQGEINSILRPVIPMSKELEAEA